MKLSTSFPQTAGSKYFIDRDLNCAEAVLAASNDRYSLGLDSNGLRCAAGFGGGMGIRSVCGALTGSIMVMSNLFVKDRAHESTIMKEVNNRLFDICRERYGSIDCDVLKDAYYTEEQGCRAVVEFCAEILEQVVEEFSGRRVR